jgi:OmpA-OmpF porin, OOP family
LVHARDFSRALTTSGKGLANWEALRNSLSRTLLFASKNRGTRKPYVEPTALSNGRGEVQPMNIVQTLLGLFNSPQLLETIAGLLRESTTTTQKGIAAAIPAILGGLVSRGSTEAGADALIGMMREHKIDSGLLDRLGTMFGGSAGEAQVDAGRSMLSGILGGNLDAVTKLVGSVSGMSNEGAGKLMSLVAPAVLGGVAKAAPSGGFTAAGLMGLLASQKEHFAKLAPPGLGSLLGIGGLGAAVSSIARASSSTVVSTSVSAGSTVQSAGVAASAMTQSVGARALWPWLVFLGVLCLAFLLGLKSCSTPLAEQAVSEEPVASDAVEPEAVAPAEPAPAEITLPSGTVLTVPPGSVGENLFNFLSGNETGSKTFLFDGLTFETGSATLDADSQATIAAISEILKEFGAATVSVDGYTDNTGLREANLRLSESRARQVMAALAAAGIDASRMTAAGHADDNPVASNDTEEGRAQNRRTELTATKN